MNTRPSFRNTRFVRAVPGLIGALLLLSTAGAQTPGPARQMPVPEPEGEPPLGSALNNGPTINRTPITSDHIPAWNQINRWHGARLLTIWRGDPARKEVALTFDDGPHPAFTPRLLDLLRQLHVKATFFLVGKKVEQAPLLVARMAREGHEVANHTFHHLNLSKLPEELVESEIRLGNQAIYRACGRQPTLFRPPGGHHDDTILRAAEKLNMVTVLWTDDPADFARPGADVIEKRVLDRIGNGADILLHDGVEQTLEVLPDLVARLRRDGYRFVTMSEMVQHLEMTHLEHK